MKVSNCAGCGAEITFASHAILIAVCEFCQSMNAQGKVDPLLIGKVAVRTPLASYFQLGTRGRFQGQGFVVRGQIQLDHGAGLWNEWVAEDDTGKFLWIAEAQGELLVMEERGPVQIPADKVQARDWLSLEEHGRWLVTEVGRGKVVTVAGELPVRLSVGKETTYADIAQGHNAIGTLDWTRGEAELFTGIKVELEQLELDPQTQPEHTPLQIDVKRIDCASCGDSITLHDPEGTRRVGCESCGTLLDVTSDKAQVLEANRKLRTRPSLPIGAEGVLRGMPHQVLAYMVRSVRAGGQTWPWREYLLRRKRGGYRWLTETDGHWTYVEPLHPTAAKIKWKTSAQYLGQTFKHFNSGRPRVECVLGECYWDVKVDDQTSADDYVCGINMLSFEDTDTERVASIGTHLDRDELAAAFPGAKLPTPVGVGAVTPNPVGKASTWWKLWAMAALAFVALRVVFGLTLPDEPVMSEAFVQGDAANDHVEVTKPFSVYGGNLLVKLSAPTLMNNWLGVDGALIDEETGDVTTFGVDCGYWTGVADGSTWREGSRNGEVRLGPIPGGRYLLRVDPLTSNGAWQPYHIEIRRGAPRTWPMWTGILVLALMAGAVTLRWLGCESQRWANSDHPWGQQ